MLNVIKLRSLYESRVRKGDGSPNPRGRTAFVNEFRHMLGLCDRHGNNYRDRHGNRVVRVNESVARPEDFSVQEMAVATCGPYWQNFFDPTRKAGIADFAKFNRGVHDQFPGDERALLEAAGVGIDVSAFSDINAWTSVTGGLIERKILEAFQNPDYIGDDLMDTEPTKIAEGQKVIGVSRLGDKALERQPGEAHARTGLLERWVQLGKTRENALAVDVFKEAAFFDLTGQLLDHAGQHGDWIRYRKEIDQLSSFAGVAGYTGSTGKWAFNYKGTNYGLYLTSAATQPSGASLGYVSSLASNDLVDWKSVEAAWLIMQRQLDPETGTRVLARPDTLVVNPARMATATLISQAVEAERRTANTQGSGTGTAQSTTGDLHILRANTNVVSLFGMPTRILWSPLLEQICTNGTTDAIMPGLGLSQSNADQRWWWFARGKVFKYMSNWPLTITQAPATNYDMIDKGIVASFFGDERGMVSVWSPWHMMNSTN